MINHKCVNCGHLESEHHKFFKDSETLSKEGCIKFVKPTPIKRFIIIGNVLDNRIFLNEHEFKDEEELNEYLDVFSIYDKVLCLNEEQFKNLKIEVTK